MPSHWITNVRIVSKELMMECGSVRIENGKIAEVCEGIPENTEGGSAVNGQGQLLIPGMIDVHIHGANGYDMMDGTTRSIEEVSRTCAKTGCTSFLATSVSSSLQDLLLMVDNVKKVAGREPGAKIVGIHTEGPYLNAKRKGMQNEAYIRHPDLAEMNKIIEAAGAQLKMATIAPELPGGMELVSALREHEIIVAIAHSDATYDEATEAFELGASHITHCFNGMRPIHHRDPGLIVAAFEQPRVSLQAIVDHVHLHPAIVRLMHRIKGPDNMVLITDAMQAMGMGDGEYHFGGHHVSVVENIARLKDGTLASSTVTMNKALKYSVELGIPLQDAVTMACRTPADLLGLKQKGRIIPGADADLVLLDEQFQVIWTMIDGHVVHKESCRTTEIDS